MAFTARSMCGLRVPTLQNVERFSTLPLVYAVYVQKRDIKCACVGGGGRHQNGGRCLAPSLMLAFA